jgi:ornithine cyclodeaminase/alanine dehydrogenase-like protein (mu-crystallin family)
MLYLTESDVRRFLPMKDCIVLMRNAFERLASGEALNQPRRRLFLPTRSTLHCMAASDGRYFGAKIYATNPGHGATFRLLLYRAGDAELLALIEANYLGQIRTGATSGLATSLLARQDSRTVAIIGSGFQARSQLEAVALVRNIERVRVWSRSLEKRNALAAESGSRLGIPAEAVKTGEEAVRDADIVVTATSAATPVLESTWIAPGTHINAMGSNHPQRRELPEDLVRRARLIVVDDLENSRMESGDLLMALGEEEWKAVVELRDVASGDRGRTDPEELTIFKSNGLAVEDVIAAGLVYERALEAGAGRTAHS